MSVLSLSQVRINDKLYARVAGSNLEYAFDADGNPNPALFKQDKDYVIDPQVPHFVREMGSSFMLRSYDLSTIPDGVHPEHAVNNTVRAVYAHPDFQCYPTLTYINGNVFVMLYVRGEDRSLRPYGSLYPYAFQSMPKTMKRLSIFGWSERFYHTWDRQVHVRSLPENSLFDGISFIRTSTFKDLCLHDSEAYAQVFDKQGNVLQRRFHMRVVTPHGLIKGDFILVDDLPYDIVTNEHNVCPEIWSQDNRTRAMAFVQHQFEPALTNVQLLNYFYQHFWQESDLLRSLRVDVGYHITRIEQGDAPDHVLETLSLSDEGLDSVDRMADRETVISNSAPLISQLNQQFKQRGVPKNISARLVSYAAHGSHMTFQPEIAQPHRFSDEALSQSPYLRNQLDRILMARRFVLPFAVNVSLTSESAARQAGVDISLQPQQAHVDSTIGLIVCDKDYEWVADILGGGDQDDHITVGLIQTNSGELYVVLIRNPIGNQSDGQDYGVEYVILSPTALTVNLLIDRERKRWKKAGLRFRPNSIPVVNFDNLPTRVDEVNRDVGMTFNQTENVPPYDYVYTRRKAAVAAKAARVYGTHCLLSMAAYNADIALSPVGPEGDVIDACTQYYVAEDVNALERKNQEHLEELAGHFFDQALYVRLPSAMRHNLSYSGYDGPMTQLMQKYDYVVNSEFIPQAQAVLDNTLATLKALVEPYVQQFNKLPAVDDGLSYYQDKLRGNSKRRLSPVEFQQAADNYVANFRQRNNDDPDNKLLIVMIRYLVWKGARSGRVSGVPFTSCVKDSSNRPGADMSVLNGQLAEYVIQAYKFLIDRSS